MNKKLTTSQGNPYYEHQDSQTVGPRGPVLLQDFILQENLAHFVRERIPERVVHAKGSGAYGKFTVTNDISQYSKAKLFSKIGNSCRVFTRFSTLNISIKYLLILSKWNLFLKVRHGSPDSLAELSGWL